MLDILGNISDIFNLQNLISKTCKNKDYNLVHLHLFLAET